MDIQQQQGPMTPPVIGGYGAKDGRLWANNPRSLGELIAERVLSYREQLLSIKVEMRGGETTFYPQFIPCGLRRRDDSPFAALGNLIAKWVRDGAVLESLTVETEEGKKKMSAVFYPTFTER